LVGSKVRVSENWQPALILWWEHRQRRDWLRPLPAVGSVPIPASICNIRTASW
jgi:hypothetical protein